MTDLHETMTEIAEQAPEQAPGLLDRVEAGYQRRRRRHTAFTAAAAVLVLAVGGWVVLRPSTGDMTAGFHLPSSVDKPRPLRLVWPAATVSDEVPETPDGGQPTILRVHEVYPIVLGRDTLYLWDVWNRRYDEIIRLGFTAAPEQTVLRDKWLVSIHRTGTSVEVWRFAAWGGSRKRITTLPSAGDVRGMYVSGDDVYLSTTAGTGVIRVGLESGDSERLAGFDELVSDSSGWARNADGTIHRNLVTGEERRQPRPVDVQTWDCVPAFCLGQSNGDWFLQDVGGARERLPYPGTPSLIGVVGDSGILRVADGVLLDPKTGKFANPTDYVAPVDAVQCDADGGQYPGGVYYRWREAPNGGSCDGPWMTAYID